MGTWGTGLYADDTALDLRSEWGEKMKWDGRADAVTEQLVAQYGADDTTFWLALADLQWKCGHLAPRVRERALAIIADGADLARWSDASAADQRARAGVLERLRAQLGTPPPAPKTYKRPAAADTKMKVGEVYSWRLLDGRHTFFQVAGITQGIGAGLSPELRIIDLVSASVPSAAELAALPTRKTVEPRPAMEKIDPRWKEHPLVCFKIRGPAQEPKARLERLGVAPLPFRADDKPMSLGTLWIAADEFLARLFGIGWTVGDVFAWTREGAAPAILSMSAQGSIRRAKVASPYLVLEIQAWAGPGLPTPAELRGLAPIAGSIGPFPLARFLVAGMPPVGRLAWLGHVARERADGPGSVFDWDQVDATIARCLARAGMPPAAP
jgi:hypothetical protein